MITNDTAEKIYDVMSKQGFQDFHDGPFENHIRSDENCLNKEQILEKIKQLFARLEK